MLSKIRIVNCFFAALLLAIFALSVGVVYAGDAGNKLAKRFEVLGIGGAGAVFTPSSNLYDKNFLLISCDMSGSYRSFDGGKSWEAMHWKQIRSSLHCKPLFQKERIFWLNGNSEIKVTSDRGSTWKTVFEGKAPWGNTKVIELASIPGKDDTLIAGTEQDLWRSDNAGKSWTKVLGGKIDSLVCLKSASYAIANGKFYTSANDGSSWSQIPVSGTNGMPVRTVVAGESDGETRVICLAKGVPALISTDSGKSWKQGAMGMEWDQMVMAPNQTKVAFASRRGSNEIFRTKDGGATWHSCFHIYNKAKNIEVSWIAKRWGFSLSPNGMGVNQNDTNVVMISSMSDFYISNDGGDTWRQSVNTYIGKKDGDPGDYMQSNGFEVTSCWKVYFDPNEDNRLYVAFTDLTFARSIDRGKSFTRNGCIEGSPWGNTTYSIAFDPYEKGKFYASMSAMHDIPTWGYITDRTDKGGVIVSEDYGITARVAGRGLPNAPCTYVAVDKKNSKPGAVVLYATSYGYGVYKSVDSGATWVRKSNGVGTSENQNVYMVQVDEKTGNVYCSVTAFRESANFFPGSGLYKSTDGGESWKCISSSIDLRWAGGFVVHPENPEIIYIAAATAPKFAQGGVYKTVNGGKVWKHIITDKDLAKIGGLDYSHCFFINMHPDNSDYIYLGTEGHGLWMSKDAGATWDNFKDIPFSQCQNVTFDPKNTKIMYSTTFGGGIWKGPYLP